MRARLFLVSVRLQGRRVRTFRNDQTGVTIVEYGLAAALLAAGLTLAAFFAFGDVLASAGAGAEALLECSGNQAEQAREHADDNAAFLRCLQ